MYLAMAFGCILMFFDPVWLRFIGCLLLGIPALMLLYRQMRPRLDAGAFIMEGRFRDLLGPCGVILDPDIFLGETAYTATLRLPLETLPMDAMRSRQDALLFLSALSLTMDASAHGPAIDQVLGGMHADAARIRRMLKVQSTLELRGSHGVVTMDGGREMGFFLLEDAPGDARRSFLSICGMIREQGRERRMTNEDRSAIMLLPEDTLLLACAEMNQVPSNLTFLGSMILHEIDTPHPDALEALSALEAKGIPVTYLQPEGTRYDPVQAMHIPLEPCDTTAGRFTVHASGEDRRFDLAFLSYLAQARGQVLYLMWCLCFLVLSAAGILLMPGLPIGSTVFLAGAIRAGHAAPALPVHSAPARRHSDPGARLSQGAGTVLPGRLGSRVQSHPAFLDAASAARPEPAHLSRFPRYVRPAAPDRPAHGNLTGHGALCAVRRNTDRTCAVSPSSFPVLFRLGTVCHAGHGP